MSDLISRDFRVHGRSFVPAVLLGAFRTLVADSRLFSGDDQRSPDDSGDSLAGHWHPRYRTLLLPVHAAQEGSSGRHRYSGLHPDGELWDILLPAGYGPDGRGGAAGGGVRRERAADLRSIPGCPKVEEIEDEGYDGIVTLLNPSIPFEKVLLEQELQQGEETGIEVYSYPMLPWVSENEESLAAIKQLVAGNEGRYYIHCYLGKHRVELVRRELIGATEDTITVEEEPLKSSLERGQLSAFDQERIVLGPYPTDEE